MIEVIKHGQKKFKATCSHCGCEFTYEMEDVKGGWVTCPDCGQHIVHPNAAVNNGGLHYPSDCRSVQFVPKTEYPPTTLLLNTTTDANKAGTILGDVYTTEKDLEIQQMFKDQMSKKPFIPCTDKE